MRLESENDGKALFKPFTEFYMYKWQREKLIFKSDGNRNKEENRTSGVRLILENTEVVRSLSNVLSIEIASVKIISVSCRPLQETHQALSIILLSKLIQLARTLIAKYRFHSCLHQSANAFSIDRQRFIASTVPIKRLARRRIESVYENVYFWDWCKL